MDITLKEWLYRECLPEEIIGDVKNGYYLGIVTIRKKLKFMEDEFDGLVNYRNFNQTFLVRPDKEVFVSGSMEIKISAGDYYKELVGAYSFNIKDYDNETVGGNEQYAGTLKTLCIRNAFGNEYPQFGSLLNEVVELNKTERFKSAPTTSSLKALKAINDSLSK